jgi:RNA polymerase sigma factor (TIGR02999 family)
MSEVTRILEAVERGDRQAANELLPLVYGELRTLAAQHLAHEKPGQTLQPTALVHEAYLRLVGPANAEGFADRRHFFGAAAEAMRRILVESARRKRAEKHGGAQQRIGLAEADLASPSTPERWLLLDDAIVRLALQDPAAAEVAKLRLFAGVPAEVAAELLGVSRATAFRHWTYARAWLHSRLREDQ